MRLSEFLGKFDAVEPSADGYLAVCPSHADSHPSLRIGVSAADKVLLKCRAGCQTSDVLAAVSVSMKTLATLEVDDAAPKHRATSTDAPASPAAIAALAVEIDSAVALLSERPAVVEYARRRFGLSDDDITRLRLGAQDDGPISRLLVPFLDERGVPRGYQARALDANAAVRWKGPHSPSDGGSWAKLGYFTGTSGWTEIIVTEGPGDALTAVSLGYDAIPIRGAGLAKNPHVIAEIARLAGARKVVIAGDGDEAGWEFSATLARGLLANDVSAAVLSVPDGEDLSSWREKSGAEPILKAVNTSRIAVTTAVMGRELDDTRYPLTDTGAARWLRDYVRRQNSDVRYTPEAGFFLLRDGVWYRDALDTIRAWAQDAFETMTDLAFAYLNAAQAEGNEEAEKRANKRLAHARKYQNTLPQNNALTQLRALRDVAANLADFDRNPNILAAKNGVIDLRTGALMPHSGAYMLTQCIAHDYDPQARAPRWEQYLREVFPANPEMPAYLKRLIGYGITGRTDEQCFAIHWGAGANGKSIFTDTLTDVFRDCTVTTAFSTFERRTSGGIPNDLAALKGARLVMASEGEADVPMAEAVLKRVTGHDLISARYLHQEFFEFRPQFLLQLATNSKPRFRGQDEGLWRRVKLIPWVRYFAPHERDHKLSLKLLAEAEGILAWAVEGAIEWYHEGVLGDPESVVAATEIYRQNSNTLDGFLPGVFELGNTDDEVAGPPLYEAYLTWAEDEHLSSREIWTRRTFYAAMEERGARKMRRATGMVFVGIRHADGKKSEQTRAADDSAAHLSVSTGEKTGARTVSGASLDDISRRRSTECPTP